MTDQKNKTLLCPKCKEPLIPPNSSFVFECLNCGSRVPVENVVSFDRRDELLKIKQGDIKENIFRYIERQSGERSLLRFVTQGLITTLFSCVPTVLGSTLRGVIYRAILGKVGSLCYIEKNVRFNAAHRIFLGDRVTIGEGTTLNAGVREKTGAASEINLGNNVRIPRYCVLKAGPGNIFIDNFVGVGQFCWLDGTGGLDIGKYTQIASHVVVMSTSHNFRDPLIPISFQGKDHQKVTIGNDVWIGSHAVVLAGVTIGDGCVIAAGAIVTQDIAEYSVAVGVPATVISKRK